MAACLGVRTQRLGKNIHTHLVERGMEAKKALAVSREIAGVFGKIKEEKGKEGKKDSPTYIEQLAFISPEEQAAALALADRKLYVLNMFGNRVTVIDL